MISRDTYIYKKECRVTEMSVIKEFILFLTYRKNSLKTKSMYSVVYNICRSNVCDNHSTKDGGVKWKYIVIGFSCYS